MSTLSESADLVKAVTAIAWPILGFCAFLAFRTKLGDLLNRQNLTIKVAGMELSVVEATQNIGGAVADLQKRLSDAERRLDQVSGTKNPLTSTAQATNADPSLEKAKLDENISREFSILWVDDVPANNGFLVDNFKSGGIHVDLPQSTRSAMEYFKPSNYDLVITDLGRREDGISNAYAGLALIKKIRATGSDVPIIVYAGQRGVENKDRLIAAGASAVIQSAVELQGFVSDRRHALGK